MLEVGFLTLPGTFLPLLIWDLKVGMYWYQSSTSLSFAAFPRVFPVLKACLLSTWNSGSFAIYFWNTSGFIIPDASPSSSSSSSSDSSLFSSSQFKFGFLKIGEACFSLLDLVTEVLSFVFSVFTLFCQIAGFENPLDSHMLWLRNVLTWTGFHWPDEGILWAAAMGLKVSTILGCCLSTPTLLPHAPAFPLDTQGWEKPFDTFLNAAMWLWS
jgi:hypothetical protein